jgi:hypothetical protein
MSEAMNDRQPLFEDSCPKGEILEPDPANHTKTFDHLLFSD